MRLILGRAGGRPKIRICGFPDSRQPVVHRLDGHIHDLGDLPLRMAVQPKIEGAGLLRVLLDLALVLRPPLDRRAVHAEKTADLVNALGMVERRERGPVMTGHLLLLGR